MIQEEKLDQHTGRAPASDSAFETVLNAQLHASAGPRTTPIVDPKLEFVRTQPSQSVTQVGRYRILERLGQGGMASVYKAFDPGIDRTIAIKFLHSSLAVDENYRSRFLREAKAAGVLSHPNIVGVYDVGEIEGQPYIAMELVEGAPLSDVLQAGTPLPMREVVEIGIQLARALDYAHSKGVIHRDIKPSNILRVHGTNNIKVTDFGIAHVANTEATQHTRLGDVLGTPEYMSPEQALGQKVDRRSDLFSVGVVLFHLVTGKRPFEADSLATLMYRIAKEEPASLEKLRGDVPASLKRIIGRCLKKQADKRYRSGAELAEALAAQLQELDDQARERAEKRIVPLRVRWTLLMAAVVAVTMAVSSFFVTQRQHAALVNQVVDYGGSLTRFLATESAVPVLSEDWIAIEIFVQEVMKTQDFRGITLVDHTGVVRASSDPQLVGQRHSDAAGERVPSRDKTITVTRYTDAAGVDVLDFQGPITFQGKNIGHAHLLLPVQPLSKVNRLTYATMAILLLITVLSVALATYVLADQSAKPIRVLRKAMRDFAKGKYERRIEQKRNDEFGLLYQSFDEMAAALQEKLETSSPANPS